MLGVWAGGRVRVRGTDTMRQAPHPNPNPPLTRTRTRTRTRTCTPTPNQADVVFAYSSTWASQGDLLTDFSYRQGVGVRNRG